MVLREVNEESRATSVQAMMAVRAHTQRHIEREAERQALEGSWGGGWLYRACPAGATSACIRGCGGVVHHNVLETCCAQLWNGVVRYFSYPSKP